MEEKSKITDKITDKRLKNLRPAWKKGDKTPNPKGRGKGTLNYATIREMAIRSLAKLNNKTPLEIDVEIQANALLEARKGNFQFYKDDKDRVHGQAVTKIEVNTNEETVAKAKQAIKDLLNDNTGNN